MKRSKSSQRWMKEHFDDEYVLRAQKEGYRSRAVYKLDEIQKKGSILKPGMVVVDLGAAPGGWCQYGSRILGKKGRMIGLDILPIEPIQGVELIQGDFREQEVFDKLLKLLQKCPVDLVISDMAPNISGQSAVDQPRSVYLCELALDLSRQILKKNGDMLIKAFQGEGYSELEKDVRTQFNKVTFRKPRASRPRSNEIYILARGFEV